MQDLDRDPKLSEKPDPDLKLSEKSDPNLNQIYFVSTTLSYQPKCSSTGSYRTVRIYSCYQFKLLSQHIEGSDSSFTWNKRSLFNEIVGIFVLKGRKFVRRTEIRDEKEVGRYKTGRNQSKTQIQDKKKFVTEENCQRKFVAELRNETLICFQSFWSY